MNDALELCRKELSATPGDDYFLNIQACLIRRIFGWIKSLKYWEASWRKYIKNGRTASRFKEYIFTPPPLLMPFEEVTIDVRGVTKESKKKVCVYTSLFGAYDEFQPVSKYSDNIDFICFTDQDINVQGWEIIKCEAKYNNPILCAKEYKILAHKYLCDYDASLFLDASSYIYDDISPLINRFLINEKFVMFKHPVRNCAHVEGETILTRHRHLPLPVVKQLEKYEIDGLPPGAGMVEASFIWRSHKDPGLIKFMELWWEEINNFSTRDQLSLCYLMWKMNCRPKVLPEIFGTSKINPYFFKRPHNSHTKTTITTPLLAELCFLYHEKYENSASSQMRGKQLVDIINSQAGKLQALFTRNLNIKNKCVFLTKGLLKKITIKEISKLKKNNYFVAADYVDILPRDDLHDYIDIYVASSILGFRKLIRKKKDKWVFLLTHHADPRIQVTKIPMDKLRTGYFGELVNTLHHEDLSDLIDFHGIDTRTSSSEWLDEISNYNLHYAVRNVRKLDYAKPFLKGFTAARCGANILVDRYEGDAMYYLPPDYPFFIDNNSETHIRDTLNNINNGFGLQDWAYGLEAMKNVRRRCSNDYIYNELSSFIDSLRTRTDKSSIVQDK